MGQMKKLYELTDEQDKPFLYFMQRTKDLTKACEDVLDRIRTAEYLIGDFLEEGWTTDLFAARSILVDAINLLEGPHGNAQGAGGEVRRSDEDRDDSRPGADARVPAPQD